MGAICHHHGDIFSFYNLLSCVSNKSVQLSRKTSRCQNFTLSIAISICKYTHSLIAALDPTRLGVDKVKPKVWSIWNSARLFHHVLFNMKPVFGPSCTEFVFPECLHFDNDATSKNDDVLLEHGRLPNVLPLAVHLDK